MVDATAGLFGGPERIGDIADCEQRGGYGHGDRNDHQRCGRKIDDVSEQYGGDRPGGTQGSVFQVVSVFDQGAGMAANEPDKVERKKRDRSDVLFQRKCEEVESEHVEQQMWNICMHESAGDHRAELLLAPEEIRPKQAPVYELWQLVKAEQTGRNSDDQDACGASL